MKYKKFLGQHFLHDTVKIAKIVNFINPSERDLILEIGPGNGALTSQLIKKKCKIISIEIDKEAIELLTKKIKDRKNFILINSDFLKINIKEIYEKEKTDGRFLIVGNIPYYITSPIIEKIIENREIINEAYLTLQKEVAERIVAKEGSKKYGTLSIWVQFYSNPEILFDISRKAFFPEPKVDSAFLKFEFLKRKKYNVKDENLFFKLIKIAFSQRRKKIINNLSRGFKLKKEEIAKIFKELNIDFNKRAEDISIIDFIKISDKIYENLN